MKIIDLSEFNGSTNFAKIKKSCDGVIFRAGYRGYTQGSLKRDKKVNYYITEAKKVKIPFGLYYVTQAINENEAIQEAKYVLDVIKGYKIKLPIFIDTENANNGNGRADAGKLTREKRTSIMIAFCKEIENAGYTSGVYASESWFNDHLDINKLKNYILWVAKYSSKAPAIKYDAWQYSDNGNIDGVAGRVDVSEWKDENDTKTETKTETTKKATETKKEEKKTTTKATAKIKYYTVKKGDTLTKIAKTNKTTIDSLVSLNKISDANKIYIGQRIRIK
jgi:GH25 family lysozyme M1 (1,4-beta-N-acetylmuramidase)